MPTILVLSRLTWGMILVMKRRKKSLFGRLMKSLSKDLDQGIETGYYLTLSEEIKGLTGYYFDEKKVKSVSEKGYSLKKHSN